MSGWSEPRTAVSCLDLFPLRNFLLQGVASRVEQLSGPRVHDAVLR